MSRASELEAFKNVTARTSHESAAAPQLNVDFEDVARREKREQQSN